MSSEADRAAYTEPRIFYLSFGCSLCAQTFGLLLLPFLPREATRLFLLITMQLVSTFFLRTATAIHGMWAKSPGFCLLCNTPVRSESGFPVLIQIMALYTLSKSCNCQFYMKCCCRGPECNIYIVRLWEVCVLIHATRPNSFAYWEKKECKCPS